MKPFLKWAGGKSSSIQFLSERIPKKYGKYYEPFIGGGALFFHIKDRISVISDINKKLMLTYKAIKKHPLEVIEELKIHKKNNSKEYYYKQRELFNKEEDIIKLAGLFIYINKVCFNGLYRVNSKGDFNVPYGAYNNPTIFDEDNILDISRLLKTVRIHNRSFEKTKVARYCFYYFDPPYYNTFDQYDKTKFNFDLHKKLFRLCKRIDRKGGFFMVSNSDTPEIRELYKDYNIESVQVNKSISRDKNQRKKKSELIIRNYT